MKQIKQDFSFECQGSVPWVDLGGLADSKKKIQNMVILHIKLKGTKFTLTC